MTRANGFASRLVGCAVLFVMTSLLGCHARDVPIGWQTDCVGRMQLSFPGYVEVAAVSPKSWKERRSEPQFTFADGQVAGWAGLAYLGGVVISQPLTSEEKQFFIREIELGRQAVKKFSEEQPRRAKTRPFSDLPVSPQNGYAWDVADGKVAQLFIADHYFAWDSYSNISEAEQRRHFQKIVEGLAPRTSTTLPTKSGVCLPYAFINDNGENRRYVAMTYRLREHPDVTIMLKDQNAVEIDPKANPAVYDPEGISDDFWSRYDDIYRKSLRGVWNIPYKRAKLANSKGLESFVKIVRKDDTVDYGYLVVTKGDPTAKEDTPDLMLYVIQDSKNAKAKGIAPMEKEAFLSMAQTIAASVKRRPTSP
jgi:hypothetical protein